MDTKEAIKRPEGESNLSVYAIEQLRAIYANKSSDEYKSHGDIKKSVQYSNIEFLIGELYNLIDYPKNQANDMRSIFTALHNPVWNKNVTEYIKKPTVDNTTWTLVYTVGFRIMIGELARVFASTVAKDDGIHYVPSKIKEDEDRLDYIHNFNENLIKKLNDNINSKKSSTVTKEAFEMLDAYIESGALNEEVYTSIFLEGAGMCPKCGKEPCVCECGDNIAPTEEAFNLKENLKKVNPSQAISTYKANKAINSNEEAKNALEDMIKDSPVFNVNDIWPEDDGSDFDADKFKTVSEKALTDLQTVINGIDMLNWDVDKVKGWIHKQNNAALELYGMLGGKFNKLGKKVDEKVNYISCWESNNAKDANGHDVKHFSKNCKELVKLLETAGTRVKNFKEYGEIIDDSSEILYEAVTVEKVDSCIANCINGFTQIINKITKEGCTQKQFKKFWSATQEGNLWIGTKWTVDGEKFKKSVKKTMKYLTKGANKGVFGENGEEARKCYDVLLVTYKNCNDAAAGKMALDKLPESCNKALESLKAVRGKIGNAPISEFFVDASDDYMFEFEYEESNEEVVTEAVLNLSGVVDIANDVFRVFTKTFSAIFRSVKELRPKSFVNACLTKSYEKKVDKFAESVTMYKETKDAYDDYMKLPEARRKDKIEHKYLKLIDKYNAKMENRKAKIIHYDQRSIEETMDEAKKVMQDVEKTSTKPDPNTSSEASGTDINDAPANTPPEDLGF